MLDSIERARILNPLVVLGCVMAVLIGCADHQASPAKAHKNPPHQGRREGRPIYGQSLSTVAFQSLTDWTSYTDLVAVITVQRERETPDSPPARPDDLDARTLRWITVSIDRTLWSRTDATPRSLEFLAGAWTTRKGVRHESRDIDGPYLEIGQRYVAALTLDDDPGLWTPSSAQQVVDGRIQVHEGSKDAALQLSGLNPDQLKAKLAATPPDPLAVKYEDMPAGERYGYVHAIESGKIHQ